MRKLLPLFALLMLLPILAMAEAAAPLGVDTLAPIACEATPEDGTIDLYCGPTQGFYRAGNQALDLGKPYVYFGQFDCWAMVAQGTPDAFGPVGWVESALLETLPDVPELSFESALTAMVEEDALVTNDPLGIAEETSEVYTLVRGTEVIILAEFHNWLYVQTEIDGIPARVFIPTSTIL